MDDSAVVFPVSDPDTGARSSSAFARAVVADALASPGSVPEGAAWRTGYPAAFRALVEAGLESPASAVGIASRGLAGVHTRLGIDLAAGPQPTVRETVTGPEAPSRRVRIPYRGETLTGAQIDRRLDDWLAHGVIEPSCAEAVRTVASHPEWLDLSDMTFVVIGAGAQMGPVPSLLAWGAEVIAVDRPGEGKWERLRAVASRSAGRMHIVQADVVAGPGPLARLLAGRDLRGRSMVLGNYVYAHGADHVLAAAAVDALTAQVLREREDVSLSFLGTPTDVYAVPPEIVKAADASYGRAGVLRAARPVLRTASRGRLAQRHYLPMEPVSGGGLDDRGPAGITDSLVLQQGANYALAKRIQRWRAAVARADSATASFVVAPPSRTDSVLSNRLLRAAYDGAHRFGVEVFDPATSNALMAVLLVHDLRNPRKHAHPWQHEVDQAAHGGLWRQGYVPRTVLGMAVGFGARSLVRK
jgi:hypothetical protein